MKKLRVAVLISGRGSNMKALIDAGASPEFPAEIVLVISNVGDAAGLAVARTADIPTRTIEHRSFGKGEPGRRAFETALSTALKEAKTELVCLAGFMRLLSPAFVKAWENRLTNIHPSLLPAFKGLDVHRAMIEAGVKIAGCTVHFVSAEMDAGPIIGQAAVPVLSDDTPESLAQRILAEEHRLYPECVRRIAVGDIRFAPNGTVAVGGASAAGALLNPAPVRRPR
jgi:phosphoribosylglycinamide formyltransferase-1